MANENEEVVEKAPKKKKGKKLIIIVLALVLAGGGAGAYFFLKGKSKKDAKVAGSEHGEVSKKVMMDMNPFIVNLVNQKKSKFLKVNLSLELADEIYKEKAKEYMPEMRDVVITLLTSKGADELVMPEGKLQLKDDINMRLNQILGKSAVKNVYLTDFVMQ